jgi:hypothetical protein
MNFRGKEAHIVDTGSGILSLHDDFNEDLIKDPEEKTIFNIAYYAGKSDGYREAESTMQASLAKNRSAVEYKLNVITTKGLDELIPRFAGG